MAGERRPSVKPRPGSPRRRNGTAVAVLVTATVGFGCQDNEPTVARGDRLWADSSYTAALAEYRLAVAQRGDEDALARLAHAYAMAGDLTRSRQVYDELVDGSNVYADQAVQDYLALAARAQRRGDVFGVSSAVDAALALRPELRLPGMALSLARMHGQRGDTDRAAEFYRRALSSMEPDSAPRIHYELGLLEEEGGRCDRAIDHFRAFRVQAERSRSPAWRTLLGEGRWHIGNCSFQLAQEARREGQVSEALSRLATMIELGEPENLLDQAWFDRGEILYGIGRFDEALESYRTVLERNPARTGQLVERARQRIDDIRFGAPPIADSIS